jgi:hypothetical protein
MGVLIDGVASDCVIQRYRINYKYCNQICED